jgi:hypothetical protein
MSSTEIAAMTAPTALMRKAIVKPAFSARPLARTCVAMNGAGDLRPDGGADVAHDRVDAGGFAGLVLVDGDDAGD